MERTHQPPHPGSEPSDASNRLAALPVPAMQTLLGLNALIGSQQRIPLDPGWIARQLLDGLPVEWATDRIERDVLELEDAGHVVTWPQDGREWLALPHSGHGAVHHASGVPAASSPRSSTAPIFIGLGERERERERTSARARERARARVEAEQRESAARWELEHPQPAPRRRPQRPRILDAPPRGCRDHPNGTIDEECGPCGTAADIRRTWLKQQQYMDELTLFEQAQEQEQWPNGVPDEIF